METCETLKCRKYKYKKFINKKKLSKKRVLIAPIAANVSVEKLTIFLGLLVSIKNGKLV